MTAEETVARAISAAEGCEPDSQSEPGPRDKPCWELYADTARSAIIAYHAWIDANGWQIVPKEPTRDMRLAANAVVVTRTIKANEMAAESQDFEFYVTGYEAEDIYRAMLSAAPSPEADAP